MKILMAIVFILLSIFLFEPVMTLLHQAGPSVGTLGTILAYCVIGAPFLLGIGLLLAAFKRKSCGFFIKTALFLAAIAVLIVITLKAQNPAPAGTDATAKPAPATSTSAPASSVSPPAKEQGASQEHSDQTPVVTSADK